MSLASIFTIIMSEKEDETPISVRPSSLKAKKTTGAIRAPTDRGSEQTTTLPVIPLCYQPVPRSDPVERPRIEKPTRGSDQATAALSVQNMEATLSSRPEIEKARIQDLWRPDVFVRAYIPTAFTAVNAAPAQVIPIPPVDGIDYVKYVAAFGSPRFLPQTLLEYRDPPTRDRRLISSVVDENDYGKILSDSIHLDLQAQEPEVRSFDLFGVELYPIDYSRCDRWDLHVAGLREGTPHVAYGDKVLLRQLMIDTRTGLPYTEQNIPDSSKLHHPGFTGFEISATVLAVDRATEHVTLSAFGMLATLPGLMRFNVSFIVQAYRIQCVLRAVADVERELASARNIGNVDSHSRSWIQRMLFPETHDGVLRGGLPPGAFTQRWVDSALNYEQMKAISAIQSGRYGSLPYLIDGPPGTGKTKTMVEAVMQLIRHEAFQGAILLCAPSDPAADTLALRLRAHLQPQFLFRMNQFSRTFAEVPQELLPWCFSEGTIFSIPDLDILMKKRVVVTTCRGADILVQARLTNRDIAAMVSGPQKVFSCSTDVDRVTALHWTALMVDEAAQATEPEVLIPISVVTPPTTIPYTPQPMFVIAGDRHQLGPRVYDRSGTNLHISLFERLSNRSLYADHPLSRKFNGGRDNSQTTIGLPFANLVRNYRSHPAILAVPSSLFYNNSLIPEASHSEDLSSFKGWQGRGWPVLFVCNSARDDCENIQNALGGGWYNVSEAHIALDYAAEFIESPSNLRSQETCIMSPFRSQVNHLRKVAQHRKLWGLNIGPMEAFQGLESRMVIICTTRTRARFLDQDALMGVGMVNEPKKFNVAITRAKQGLIVIGNPSVLATDPHWEAFMGFCWRNGLWVAETSKPESRNSDCQNASLASWSPASGNAQTTVQLERALILREVEQDRGSDAAKRFMGNHQDDEMWLSGVMAEKLVVDEADNDEEEPVVI